MVISEPADLAIAYAHAVDRRDDAGLIALFTADARVTLPARLAAGDAAEPLRPSEIIERVRRFARTRHLVFQQSIEISDDERTAQGECYAAAHHAIERDGGYVDFALSLRYLDRFARVDGQWLFSARELVVDWSSEQSIRLWDQPTT